MRRTLVAVLGAVALLLGFITAVSAPAQAAGEHCTTRISTERVQQVGGSWDVANVHWQWSYRHCGDGLSPQTYYMRSDVLNFWVTGQDLNYHSITAHWSIRNSCSGVILSADSKTVSSTGSYGGLYQAPVADGCALDRAWFHVDWLPGPSADTTTDSFTLVP